MRILFNDVIQFSNAPPELKSSALSDAYKFTAGVTIRFDKPYPINAIGIGNTDGSEFSVQFYNDAAGDAGATGPYGCTGKYFAVSFSENGLYVMEETVLTNYLYISSLNAKYVGRIGAGLGVRIPTAVAKEPSYKSTHEPRVTLSGQVIPGAGGYNYRTLSLDSRYKIDEKAMREIEAGYKTAARGYPYFIDLSDESYKLPFSKLYANEASQRGMTFQGGIRRYLYSKKFEFEERF